jgi:hypothetical protein
MIPLAFLLLLTSSRVDLFVDQVDRIPAREWRFIHLEPLRDRPALVTAVYEVASGQPAVRLILLQPEDLQKLQAGEPYEAIAATSSRAGGTLKYQVRIPGEYLLVIDNGGPEPASVRTRVWREVSNVTQLSPRRQMAVIVISFTVFFGIVTFSARRLLRGVRR